MTKAIMKAINSDKPFRWKEDVSRSIDFFNAWFMHFAPQAFLTERSRSRACVEALFAATDNLRRITQDVIRARPDVFNALRMVASPPLAVDRMMGLADMSKTLVSALAGEKGRQPRLPPRLPERDLTPQLQRLCGIVRRMLDLELFPWIDTETTPDTNELERAKMVVADRLCGTLSDPVIRNEQERRQLGALSDWLTARGYVFVEKSDALLQPGCFAFRRTVLIPGDGREIHMPVDCLVMPFNAKKGATPIFIEAKSAGDETNTNKRRKEEAQKVRQLRSAFGANIRFVLLLCGYFGPGYLGYEAAEGIDWVWEHRLDDLAAILPPGRQRSSR